MTYPTKFYRQQWEYSRFHGIAVRRSDGRIISRRDDPMLVDAVAETIERLEQEGEAGWQFVAVSLVENEDGDCRLNVALKRPKCPAAASTPAADRAA